jgi:hypothetical protein
MKDSESEYKWTNSGLLVPKGISNKKAKQSSWSLFQVFLAVIPSLGFLAFVLALLHEISYTSNYGLPIELINLDSTLLQLIYIGPSLVLAFSFGLSLFILLLIITFNSKKWTHILAFLNLIFAPSFLYASFRNYFGDESSYVTIGLLCLQLFGLVFFTFKKDFNTRVETKLKQVAKLWPAWVIFAVLGLSAFSYITGATDGTFQHEYLVPSTDNTSIVLRIYGDDVICAPLTADNKSIESSYFVLKLNEQGLKLTKRVFSDPIHVK